MNERMPVLFHLLIGAVGGFLLGSSTADGFLGLANKFVSGLAILCLAFFGRKMENSEHLRHLSDWGSIRVGGRMQFIFLRYFLFRGGILSIVLLVPLVKTLDLWPQSTEWLMLMAILLTAIVIYLGNTEWNHCESEYEAQTLRLEAEEQRDATSLTN